MLTCQNHAEHENEKQWQNVRDHNHSEYINELTKKHEEELKHLQHQHEHDSQCAIDHKAEELKKISDSNSSQMEKLRQNVTELLKVFDEGK